jgi:general secretion pathway protein E
MRDMGVEPFLLSSSLIGVLAQRLVRLLCGECRQAYTANEKDCELMGIDAANPPTLYRAGAGCVHCNQMGYRGRTGIYELVSINETMRAMIHDGSGEVELEREARRQSSGIRADGFRRVLAGATSLEEVLRVSGLE